jgi:hypothetical protein
MAMVVAAGGKNRGGKHQQEQGSSKHLFHARTVARILRREKNHPGHASSQTTGAADRSIRSNPGRGIKTEQPKTWALRSVPSQSSPNQPFRTEMPSGQFNHRPGQHMGSPIRKNRKQNAERIRASPRNRSAHAGKNQHDSIETSTSFPGDKLHKRSTSQARPPGPNSQSAGLVTRPPSRALIAPPQQEKTPRSRRANQIRFRSDPGQA